MENNAHGTTWRGAKLLVAAAFSTVIMASGNLALATGDGTTRISGNSVFSDCGVTGSDFALRMTGDLQGCLSIFVQSYTCREVNGFAHYTERGREAFVGNLRGKNGRFTTTYTINAAYASGFCDSFDFSLELSGSCVHHIQGKTGVFLDREGVYTMFDVVTNVTGDPSTGEFAPGSGGNNFLYVGNIRPADATTLSLTAIESASSTESRTSSAAALAVQRAQSGRGC